MKYLLISGVWSRAETQSLLFFPSRLLFSTFQLHYLSPISPYKPVFAHLTQVTASLL